MCTKVLVAGEESALGRPEVRPGYSWVELLSSWAHSKKPTE